MLVDEATRILQALALSNESTAFEAVTLECGEESETDIAVRELHERLVSVDQDVRLIKAAMRDLGRTCPLIGKYPSLFGIRM